MKLKKILNRFLQLHPKEIDLSLDRINRLTNNLGNPQDKLNIISITGTNGKYSTAQAIKSILEEANYKCDLYTSPHIQKINERFVFAGKEINDERLSNLLEEVEQINNKNPITFFEILTAAFFLEASRSGSDIAILESGLFHRFDACSNIKKNLISVLTSIHEDHLDWLPKNEKSIDRIIFEKTSKLLDSKIVVAEQSSQQIMNKIENAIKENLSDKIFFKKDFNYSLNENNFFYYEDRYGGLKLPCPNLLGNFQISNISTAIASLRKLEQFKISDDNIKKGIVKIKSIARLQELKQGKLKKISKNNTLMVDGSHNPLGASVIKKYLETFNKLKKIHIIIGMMNNKDHKNFISYFKNIAHSIITVDIPNQKNAIKKENLMMIVKNQGIEANAAKSIKQAVKSISKKEKNSLILFTGSLYLAGEVLNLN